MSTLQTIFTSVFAIAILIAPRALDAWLAGRDHARAGQDEANLTLAAGGAE